MRITREVGHTPGPWTCHSGMVWKDGPDVHPKGDSDGVPIAYMHREPGNGTMPVERDANARLIAAAPELLEVLKELCQDIQAGGPNIQEEWPDLYVTYQHAQTAISKAEGGKS